jgi:hypothetical protein
MREETPWSPAQQTGKARSVPDPYPRWRFFPSFIRPPDWIEPLIGVFTEHRSDIDSAVVHAKRMESNDVGTERRWNRTIQEWGCHPLPVLKTGWATRPLPLRDAA